MLRIMRELEDLLRANGIVPEEVRSITLTPRDRELRVSVVVQPRTEEIIITDITREAD